ncbi:hypothetical protein [Pedobacter heparinus]|uniref:hypothetical protein n=1 Tax=Pedobacter heparinus TaxID=984 RepID=UPI00292D12B6|nr:hypothetical protein [Pedobacter heparinus]
MKKNILYLVAFISMIFTACNPLKDEINNLKPNTDTKTMALTVTTNYSSAAAANTGIVATLNKDYAQMPNGTKANVVYNAIPAQIKPADSLLKKITYIVTDADYAATNGNAFKNFSAINVLKFLGTKYPVAVDKQLAVLSYVYFESGATSSAGVAVVETFIFLNNEWIKAYQVSQAQYISAGKLTVFNFGAADEANLTGFFNTFLKSDASVAAKAKAGDIKYVSFAYFASSNTYQRIKALIFDGVNWGTKAIPSAPLAFLKKNGTWIPDPTVYYTLIRADYNTIGASTVGTAAARANLAQFGSFDVSGGANNWPDADINAGLIVILNVKYASAPVDETVLYKITYALFRGAGPTGTKSFAKTATGFVFVPETN